MPHLGPDDPRPHGNAASNYELVVDRLLVLDYEEKRDHLARVETNRGLLNPNRRTGNLSLAKDLTEAERQAVRDIRLSARRNKEKLGGAPRRFRAALLACEEFSNPTVVAAFPYFLPVPPFQGETFTPESAWKRVEAARRACERHPRPDGPPDASDPSADFAPGSEAETTFYRDVTLTGLLFNVLSLKPFADQPRIVPPKPRRDRRYRRRRTIWLSPRMENHLWAPEHEPELEDDEDDDHAPSLDADDRPVETEKILRYVEEYGFDEKLDGREDAASKWLRKHLKK